MQLELVDGLMGLVGIKGGSESVSESEKQSESKSVKE